MATGPGRRVRRTMVDFVSGKAPTAPTNWYTRLSTAQTNDDGSGIAEPTSTGGYTNAADLTASGWTAAPNPSNDAAAVAANATAVTFPTSSAAWSTTTSALSFWFQSLSTTSTTEANFIGRGSVNNAVPVNTSGVTLSFAIGALSFTCISV